MGQRDRGKRTLNSEGGSKGWRQRSGQREFRQCSESMGQVQRAGELLRVWRAGFLEGCRGDRAAWELGPGLQGQECHVYMLAVGLGGQQMFLSEAAPFLH